MTPGLFLVCLVVGFLVPVLAVFDPGMLVGLLFVLGFAGLVWYNRIS